jgi:predicted RecA/RadA family phage recombinase
VAQKIKVSAAKSRGSGTDALRAVIVGGVLAGVSVLAYVIGTGGQTPSLRETAFSHPQQKAQDFTTGAVVVMPTVGDECRQKTIDNRTWAIQDHGAISCKEALAASKRANSRGGSTRIDVIRDSFRK